MSLAKERVPAEPHLDPAGGEARRSLTVNAEIVQCLLPEFDQVSITAIDGAGGTSTWAQAGDLVTQLDRLQHGLDQGPCIDCLVAADIVVAPHIQRDHRWTDYVSSAAQLGLKSQIAAPLRWRDDRPLGVLNLYSTTRGEIAPTAPLIARALAAQIAGVLASFRAVEDLDRALATHKSTGVAIGLLMERHQLTETAALAVLQRRSSSTNVKLTDVAARMATEANAAGLELPPAAHC